MATTDAGSAVDRGGGLVLLGPTDPGVVPDGAVQPTTLGIEIAWSDRGVVVFGPTTLAETVSCADVELAAVVRLPPSVALTSTPTHELTDRVVPAEELQLRVPDEPAAGLAWLRTAEQRRVLRRDPAVARALAGNRLNESRRSTERRFRRIVGVSPHAVRRRARVHEAARRLRAGERPTVVADVGYADHSHLARDCRELLGATPSSLRAG